MEIVTWLFAIGLIIGSAWLIILGRENHDLNEALITQRHTLIELHDNHLETLEHYKELYEMYEELYKDYRDLRWAFETIVGDGE